MRANQPLWIEGRPTLDLNTHIGAGGEGGENISGVGLEQTENMGNLQGPAGGETNEGLIQPSPSPLPEEHFMFAATAVPHAHLIEAKSSRLRTWRKRLFKRDKEKEATLPMPMLMARGREPLGWDHTNMKWYYPIWPEFVSIDRFSIIIACSFIHSLLHSVTRHLVC